MKRLRRLLVSITLILVLSLGMSLDVFAVNSSVDRGQLTANVQKVYSYVKNNGYVNGNGNYCISEKFNSDTVASIEIVGNSLVFTSFAVTSSSSGSAIGKTTMTIDLPYNEMVAPEVNVAFTNIPSIKGHAYIDPSNYNPDTSTIRFTVDSGSSSQTIQNLMNSSLKLAVVEWDTMLDINMNMGLEAVGFTSMCTHTWSDYKVIKAATYTSTGTKMLICRKCGLTKTQTIPVLQSKGADGTDLGKGASAAVAERAITSRKSDSDPEGSAFKLLQLKTTKQTKTSIKLKWKKVSGAKTYVIYANKCGKSNKMKKLTTVKGTSKTVTKAAGTKLKKNTYYKFIVVALDSSNRVVSTSKIIHVATKGGKKGNDKSVRVNTTSVSVKVKGKFTIKAKAVKASSQQKVAKHRGLKYESSNTKIAKVSSKGIITGKKKGKCYVYVYAQDGVAKKIQVTVK